MSFCIEGEKVHIKGNHKLARTLVTPKALKKESEIEAMSQVWGMEGATQSSPNQSGNNRELAELTLEQTTDLDRVLREYEGGFEEPKQLPPSRAIDHKIPIKAGVDHINVRPYRYPYLLKSEIEKQVEEMMKSGIIRPSNSPYSSPVILVKKKDGS